MPGGTAAESWHGGGPVHRRCAGDSCTVRPLSLAWSERCLVRLRLASLLLVMAGCATTPVPLERGAGPVTWRATAFHVTPVTVHGHPGERYTFTLLLHERTGIGITFARITQAVSAHDTAVATATQDGQWRLPPMGELQLPFWVVWSCPDIDEACAAVAGPPHWHITLTGTDDRRQTVELIIELDAPAPEVPIAEARLPR